MSTIQKIILKQVINDIETDLYPKTSWTQIDGIPQSIVGSGITYFSADAADKNKILATNSDTGKIEVLSKLTAFNKNFAGTGTADTVAHSDHKHVIADTTDITASAAELNVLDGITTTTSQLNYLSTVTSNVQDQLNNKTITTTETAVAGDSIVISDMSDVYKAKRGPVFGSSTTSFLRNDGQWTAPSDAITLLTLGITKTAAYINSLDTHFSLANHIHNYSEISGAPTSLPASDVSLWAKATTKPTYTYSEVGAAPESHTHSYNELTDKPTIIWQQNTKTQNGYVLSPGDNNPNKVWKTDANGNPGWQADATATVNDTLSSVLNGNGFVVVSDGSLGVDETTYAELGHTHNYSEISGAPTSLPASDVYSWAKATTKPTYTYSEISGAPTSLPASDVYSWAKESLKPTYTYSEVGAQIAGDYEPSFTKNTGFNKNFGTTAGTVVQGNDSRLSDSRPASDVYSWAKATTKPSYSYSEISGTPAIPTKTSELTNDSSFISGNQTITFTGAASGSGTTSVALTLANSGVTAGTYDRVTVNNKGIVTAGSSFNTYPNTAGSVFVGGSYGSNGSVSGLSTSDYVLIVAIYNANIDVNLSTLFFIQGVSLFSRSTPTDADVWKLTWHTSGITFHADYYIYLSEDKSNIIFSYKSGTNDVFKFTVSKLVL